MTLGGRIGLITAVLFPVLLGSAEAGSPDPLRGSDAIPVRVAYTASIFRQIAENDIKAAIKVWGRALADEMAVNAYSDVEVFPDAETVVKLFEAKRADLGSLTMLDYLRFEDRLDADPVFAVNQGGVCTVEYVILVRRESAYKQLTDLRGADLRTFDSPRTSLAIPWVELRLAERGIGSAADFFGRIEPNIKLSAVVLPVFFGQAKACLVTRDGFQTMAELNPQVGRDLRVLEKSPGVIPMVSFLRRDFRPHFRQNLIDAILNLNSSAAGRQILDLMQCGGVVILSPGALETSRELMQTWSRLGVKASARVTPTAGPERAADGGGR